MVGNEKLKQECELVGKEIKSKKQDIVIVFVQEGCPYCEMAKNYLITEMKIPEELIDYLPDTFMFLDVNECGDFGFDIKGTPYTVRVVNGKAVGRVEGFDKDGIFWLMTMKVEKDKEAKPAG